MDDGNDPPAVRAVVDLIGRRRSVCVGDGVGVHQTNRGGVGNILDPDAVLYIQVAHGAVSVADGIGVDDAVRIGELDGVDRLVFHVGVGVGFALRLGEGSGASGALCGYGELIGRASVHAVVDVPVDGIAVAVRREIRRVPGVDLPDLRSVSAFLILVEDEAAGGPLDRSPILPGQGDHHFSVCIGFKFGREGLGRRCRSLCAVHVVAVERHRNRLFLLGERSLPSAEIPEEIITIRVAVAQVRDSAGGGLAAEGGFGVSEAPVDVQFGIAAQPHLVSAAGGAIADAALERQAEMQTVAVGIFLFVPGLQAPFGGGGRAGSIQMEGVLGEHGPAARAPVFPVVEGISFVIRRQIMAVISDLDQLYAALAIDQRIIGIHELVVFVDRQGEHSGRQGDRYRIDILFLILPIMPGFFDRVIQLIYVCHDGDPGEHHHAFVARFDVGALGYGVGVGIVFGKAVGYAQFKPRLEMGDLDLSGKADAEGDLITIGGGTAVAVGNGIGGRAYIVQLFEIRRGLQHGDHLGIAVGVIGARKLGHQTVFVHVHRHRYCRRRLAGAAGQTGGLVAVGPEVVAAPVAHVGLAVGLHRAKICDLAVSYIVVIAGAADHVQEDVVILVVAALHEPQGISKLLTARRVAVEVAHGHVADVHHLRVVRIGIHDGGERLVHDQGGKNLLGCAGIEAVEDAGDEHRIGAFAAVDLTGGHGNLREDVPLIIVPLIIVAAELLFEERAHAELRQAVLRQVPAAVRDDRGHVAVLVPVADLMDRRPDVVLIFHLGIGFVAAGDDLVRPVAVGVRRGDRRPVHDREAVGLRRAVLGIVGRPVVHPNGSGRSPTLAAVHHLHIRGEVIHGIAVFPVPAVIHIAGGIVKAGGIGELFHAVSVEIAGGEGDDGLLLGGSAVLPFLIDQICIQIQDGFDGKGRVNIGDLIELRGAGVVLRRACVARRVNDQGILAVVVVIPRGDGQVIGDLEGMGILVAVIADPSSGCDLFGNGRAGLCVLDLHIELLFAGHIADVSHMVPPSGARRVEADGLDIAEAPAVADIPRIEFRAGGIVFVQRIHPGAVAGDLRAVHGKAVIGPDVYGVIDRPVDEQLVLFAQQEGVLVIGAGPVNVRVVVVVLIRLFPVQVQDGLAGADGAGPAGAAAPFREYRNRAQGQDHDQSQQDGQKPASRRMDLTHV